MASIWTNETRAAQAIGNNPGRAATTMAALLEQKDLDRVQAALLARTDAEKVSDLDGAISQLKRAGCDTATIEATIKTLADVLRPVEVAEVTPREK